MRRHELVPDRVLHGGLLLGLGAAAWLLSRVEPATAAWLPGCPFRALTELYCPGCGSTRALRSLVTGDLAAALDHNVLLVLSLPFVLVGLARRILPGTSRPPKPLASWLGWTIAIVVVLFAVARNLALPILSRLAP